MLTLAERKVILRALMDAQLALENARFEIVEAQQGQAIGEQVATIDRAINDTRATFWQYSQRERTL